MKLDPCPWCGRQPKTYTWFELSRCLDGFGNAIEYPMIDIHCCNAAVSCHQADAEEMWNWIDDFRLRSGQPTRQSNQDSLSVVYTEREDEDTDKHYRD